MDKTRTFTVAALLLLLAPVALAHPHPGHGHGGFGAGVLHPLVGLDHVLALLAVGLWATQQGARGALWVLPAAFLGAMVLGFGLGLGQAPLPLVEFGIIGSLLVLGGLVAFARRLPLAMAGGAAGVFALFHGHAHGAEMAAGLSPLAYASGFMLSTAVVLATGVAAGLSSQRLSWPVLRVGGALVALTGGCLALLG